MWCGKNRRRGYVVKAWIEPGVYWRAAGVGVRSDGLRAGVRE